MNVMLPHCQNQSTSVTSKDGDPSPINKEVYNIRILVPCMLIWVVNVRLLVYQHHLTNSHTESNYRLDLIHINRIAFNLFEH